MTDVGYVIAAWVITAAVLGGYWCRLVLRIRRAAGDEKAREPDA